MKNQRAMSEIVTTVIMVVLALIAVGVIWGIINNLLGGKGAEIDISQKCLAVDIKATKLIGCNPNLGEEMTSCNFTFERKSGGDEIAGLKVVLKSATSASGVIDLAGPVDELATVTKEVKSNATVFNATTATKIEVTPYFRDASGAEKNCPSTTEYNF